VIGDEVKRELAKLQKQQEMKETELTQEKLRLYAEHEKKEVTLKQQIKKEVTDVLTKEHS
jgi:hypothetical protein